MQVGCIHDACLLAFGPQLTAVGWTVDDVAAAITHNERQPGQQDAAATATAAATAVSMHICCCGCQRQHVDATPLSRLPCSPTVR